MRTNYQIENYPLKREGKISLLAIVISIFFPKFGKDKVFLITSCTNQ